MFPEEKDLSKPRILVAPLDWGLGHATRCIPVIYELIDQGADVWLAGEGAQEELLRREFPDLNFLRLKGYRVKYGRNPGGILRQLIFQIPGILRNIRQEHNWLQKAANQYSFDAVISDNRFGFYHNQIPSVFITHQLKIKSPWHWSEKLIQKKNYRYVKSFSECWVPDLKDDDNLAGDLSHPEFLPQLPLKYIGVLSRLKPMPQEVKKKHLFISLSGPEPQRTMLEDMIVNQVSHYNGTAIIVRGLPKGQTIIPSTNDIQFHHHLTASEYNLEIEKADYVISRSGYSTVMDIASLGKKSILIPTPGQPEQEYLATYLQQKNFALRINQDKFNLIEALETAEKYDYDVKTYTNNQLSEVVGTFVQSVRNKMNAGSKNPVTTDLV